MMNLLHFVLLVFGLVYLVTESAVFGPARVGLASLLRHPSLVAALYCRMCTAFWIGIAVHSVRPITGYTIFEAGIVAIAAVWIMEGRLGSFNHAFILEQPSLARAFASIGEDGHVETSESPHE